MVLMLIMAIIGVSAMNNTTLEEKMSANMRDRAVALQAAEVALSEAEAYLETIVDTADFVSGTSPGLYATNTEIWKTLDWKAGNVRVVATPAAESATQPRYIIELGKTLETGTNSLAALNRLDSHGELSVGDEITFFTITALGSELP
jgi:type IV pilus assembly protein PilX